MWRPKPAPTGFAEGKIYPEKWSNPFSRIFYSWLDTLLWVGFTHLWDLPSDHLTAHQADTLEHNFFARVPVSQRPRHLKDIPSHKKLDSSLRLAVHSTWMKPWWFAGIFKLLSDTLITTSPLVNKVLLDWLVLSYTYHRSSEVTSVEFGGNKPKGIGYGIGLVFAVFLMRELSAVFDQYYTQETTRIGMQQRTAIIANVHRKALRLSSRARLTHSAGNIITMIAKDSDTFDRFAPLFHSLWISPIQLIIAFALLIWTLGYSALVGLAVIVGAVPICGVLLSLLFRFRRKGVEWTDKRVRAINEIFQGIRLIKFLAWGPFFEQQNFALQYFQILQFPLMNLPQVLSGGVEFKVALDRIGTFLCAEELEEPYAIVSDLDVAVDVDCKLYMGCQTRTEEEMPFALADLKLSVPRGKIGSGKSSILEALVGEMRKTRGEVKFGGDIAYVPQAAWIQNQTVRENILFGQPYDPARYREVVQACCLRVSLARAAYSHHSIVLLDDPVHVAQLLMANCFLSGPLSNRTRILVTHALHILPQVDHVYLVEDGSITAQGAYQDLLATHSAFSRLIREHGDRKKKEDELPATSVSENMKPDGANTSEVLMQAEERVTGALMISIVLVWWTSGEFGLSQNQYIYLYAGIGGALALIGFLMTLTFRILAMFAGRKIFEKATSSLIKARVVFFDTTPIGRILSRLSKDQEFVDTRVTMTCLPLLMSLASLFGIVALVAYTFPLLTIIFIPFLVLYFLVSVFYRATSVETKRLDSILRSGLYAEVSESMTGLSTVRAYARQKDSLLKADRGQDLQNRAYFVMMSIQRWLSIRLDTFGNIIVLAIGLFAAGFRSSVNPAKIGNVLAYTVQITQNLSKVVVLVAQMEQVFNSVERLLYFGELESEGKDEVQQPPYEWPKSGEVEFRNVVMKYRPTLPPALQGVSFTAQAGEKVAICGRTGSGKSSLLQVLLRAVELVDGSIYIDNIDISTLDLYALRSAVAIVPQESPLFQGTIRQNIDPQGTLTDAELISILQRSFLLPATGVSDPISEAKFGLDSLVGDQGGNYSAGETQLIALCRALVKNSKIVVLDEATSSVDTATDAQLQRVIRTEFTNRTLLCIAHRIETIVSYDRCRVAEAGAVLDLYDQADSMFRALCDDASLTRENIVRMRQM
ncbi:multidrug resistance-associated ABC transporter [Flagelloscypha sp. PMI_526]|nr:multidrug resistance-associated ABC transporter [Flagelloscypha sp. PMI_526]